MMYPMTVQDARQLEAERKNTRKLIHEAKESALEGARVTERLRIATEQYKERLGIRDLER